MSVQVVKIAFDVFLNSILETHLNRDIDDDTPVRVVFHWEDAEPEGEFNTWIYEKEVNLTAIEIEKVSDTGVKGLVEIFHLRDYGWTEERNRESWQPIYDLDISIASLIGKKPFQIYNIKCSKPDEGKDGHPDKNEIVFEIRLDEAKE